MHGMLERTQHRTHVVQICHILRNQSFAMERQGFAAGVPVQMHFEVASHPLLGRIRWRRTVDMAPV
jgi:hypothetical protein